MPKASQAIRAIVGHCRSWQLLITPPRAIVRPLLEVWSKDHCSVKGELDDIGGDIRMTETMSRW